MVAVTQQNQQSVDADHGQYPDKDKIIPFPQHESEDHELVNQIRRESIKLGHNSWFADVIKNYDNSKRVFGLENKDATTDSPRISTNLIDFDTLQFIKRVYSSLKDLYGSDSEEFPNLLAMQIESELKKNLSTLNINGDLAQLFVQDVKNTFSEANVEQIENFIQKINLIFEGNRNWADTAEQIYRISKDSTNQGEYLYNLYLSMQQYRNLTDPASILRFLNLNPQLTDLLVSVHHGWRENKYNKSFVQVYGVNSSIPFGIRIYENTDYTNAINDLSKLLFDDKDGFSENIIKKINAITSALQNNPDVPSELTFSFMHQLASQLNLRLMQLSPDNFMYKVLDDFLENHIRWNVLSDAKPPLVKLIADMIQKPLNLSSQENI